MNSTPQEGSPLASGAAQSPLLRFAPFLVLLAAVAFAWPALSGEFVYDDLALVSGNPLIASFGNLGQVFSRGYWEGIDPDARGVVGFFRPLSTVAFMIGHQLGGGAPVGFHVVSMLVHAAASIAAYLLAARVSGRPFVGLWTGVLFALHPLHVESVAWISDVADPLMGAFCLLSLASYVRWREQGSNGRPWLAGGLFLLGLFSKEMALATIPMALVLDLGGRKHEGFDFKRGYLPFGLALLLYYGARVLVFGDWTAGFLQVTTDFGVPASRLASLRLELFGGFVGLLFWPLDLNLFRPFHPEFPAGDATLIVAGAWTVLTLAVAVLLFVKRERPGLAAWLLIPASLLPVLVRVEALGIFPLSDRYAYLAVFGFALSVCLLLARFLSAPLTSLALGALSIFFAFQSVTRTADWQDELAVFQKAVEQNPKVPYVRWGLGRVYLYGYRETKESERLERALEQYERSGDLLVAAREDQTIFRTQRDNLETNLGLGWCYLFEAEIDPFHNFQTAVDIFEKTVESEPESANARTGHGIALMMIGEDEEAGTEIRKALQLAPNSDEAHCAMGQMTLKLGDHPAAIRHFEEALRLRPDHLAYMIYLAQALEFTEDVARRRELLVRANRLYPDAPVPMNMLGELSLREQDSDTALRWFEKVLEVSPRNGFAHLNRGMVLVAQGDLTEGLAAVLRSVEVMPRDFQANYNAGALLLQTDQAGRALPFLLTAYIVRPPGSGEGPESVGGVLSTEIRKLAPESSELVWEMAEADRQRGEAESALDWANRALELDDENGLAYYTRARLYVAAEREAEALADLERAARHAPQHFGIRFDLGERLSETERKQDAIDNLLEALKLLPQAGFERTAELEIHREISRMLHENQSALGG